MSEPLAVRKEMAGKQALPSFCTDGFHGRWDQVAVMVLYLSLGIDEHETSEMALSGG